jgi:hypothetical protein
MTPNSMPTGGRSFTRAAFALALSFGAASVAFVAQPAFAAKKKEQAAPKGGNSQAFAKAAAELDKALAAAPNTPAIKAASDQARAARQAKNDQAASAAAAQVDAALGGAKAKLDAAAAVATTPMDKLKLGDMTRIYGGLIDDPALQYQGLVLMLDSGQLQPTMVGQVQFIAGVTAYQKADYAGAVKYLEMAKASNYNDAQGLRDQVLADAYKRTGNTAGALSVAQGELAAAKASGAKPSETAIRTALQAAYDGKQTDAAADLSAQLVKHYPSARSWESAIGVVSALGGYQGQDLLDLMRLMARTNSFRDARDYRTFITIADPRRQPGEVQKVMESGISSGKLPANDSVVTQAQAMVKGRIASDRASLPKLERDARAPNAPVASVVGTADAFLGYGDAAKAEALYTLALTKPGVDSARVLTRLGIAQADQGKAAEAQGTFSKVQGPRKPMAQLWSAYAAQKAGGA